MRNNRIFDLNDVKAKSRRERPFLFLGACLAVLILLSAGIAAGSDRPKLIAGAEQDYPPYEFLDKGKPAGFSVELISAVAEVMGLDIEIRTGPWNKIRQDLEQGRIDVLTGMVYSGEREKMFDFSVPHTMVFSGLFVRRDSSVRSFEDIRGREIIVQQDGMVHDYLKKEVITTRIVTVASYPEALRLLASGKHDGALLSSEAHGHYIASKFALTNLRVVKTGLPPLPYCFAVAEGNEELLYKLNEGLNILKATGKYREIYEKWFGVYEKKNLWQTLKYFVLALALIAILFTASLIWSRLLQEKVRVRTEEIKQTAEKLRESEERLRTLINGMPDIVCFKDGQGRWLEANEADLALFELRGVDYRGKKDSELAEFSGFYRDAFLACKSTDEKAWSGGSLFRGEEAIPRPDGTVKIYDVIKIPLFHPDGARKGLIVLGRDITERKRAEEALLDSEQKLKAVVYGSPIPKFVIDRDHTVIYWNKALEQITGIKENEVIGTKQQWRPFYGEERPTMADLLVDGTVDAIPELYRGKYSKSKLVADAYEATDYFSSLGKDGKWLYFTAAAIKDSKGTIIGAVETLEDITERKRAEEELNRYRKHLEDLVKERTEALEEANTELSQYAYVVSHDLRAPLRAIHNYADFLREDLEASLGGDQKMYLDALGRVVREAEMLVDDVLELSRVSRRSIHIEKVNLDVFMRGIIDSLKLPAEVEIVLANDWPTVEAEPVLLRQIFQNLIDNAVKYNTSPNRRVELGWRATGEDGYEFFVRDNGIGIDPRYHEQIFRVFERLHTREEYEGTGAGLAIVKKAAARLHGSVRVESEAGKGSTFFVTIPKTQKADKDETAGAK